MQVQLHTVVQIAGYLHAGIVGRINPKPQCFDFTPEYIRQPFGTGNHNRIFVSCIHRITIPFGHLDCHENWLCFTKKDTFNYTEMFYNRDRRHASPGYVGPVVYEERHEIKQKRTT